MKGIKSLIPRGFSRFYILYLLKEKPMIGKEIMEETEKRSGGVWKPSPGLVYPLLGRLVSEGLIAETEDGKFEVTPKGEETLSEYSKFQEQIEKQIEVLRRLGFHVFTTSKFLAEETFDRLTSLAVTAHEDITKLSSDVRKKLLDKYRAFLEGELKKIEKEQ